MEVRARVNLPVNHACPTNSSVQRILDFLMQAEVNLLQQGDFAIFILGPQSDLVLRSWAGSSC